jgi:hypothetical protein
MERAAGTIESKTFSFQPVEELENGGRLIRMSAVDLFHGDLEAEARAEFVAMLAGDNSSNFAGMYRIAGTLQGLKGTFLLEVNGSSDTKGLSQGTWRVVPNSGTSGLAGLRGTGKFSYQSKGPSSILLDYEIKV